MIISQDIKNGFVRVKREGHYFSLISASGIVSVTLQLKGSDVLRSDFWVGMSINDPIEYDTIIIQGADAPVEFWASKVSMNNQGSVNLRGAKALRTNKMLVNGTAQLTSSDLTRTAVRVRTNKDIYIGGAVVSGLGWRLAAGTMEEFPVAGGLFAYKPPALLKIENSTYTAPDNAKYLMLTEPNEIIVSDDKQTMLKWSNNEFPKLWTASSNIWSDHPSFLLMSSAAIDLIKVPILDQIFLVRMTGSNGTGGSFSYCQFSIYASSDSGLTFNQVDFIDVNLKVSESLISNSTNNIYLTLIDDILTISNSGVAVGYNVKTKEWDAKGSGELPDNLKSNIRSFVYLDNDFSQFIYQDAIGKIRKTINNGETFDMLRESSYMFYMPTRNDIITTTNSSSKSILISSDGGLSWVLFSRNATNGIEDLPAYFENGVWLKFNGQYLESYQAQDGNAIIQLAIDTQSLSSSKDKPYICNDGELLRFSSDNDGTFAVVDKWQLDLTGDITPAVVEIMELLS